MGLAKKRQPKSKRSKLLSQVYFKEPESITSLLKRSSIRSSDLVLEIGPGTGIITDQLIYKARKVIAVEKDPVLFEQLKERYDKDPRINLYCDDILNFKLPQEENYKVFSNIPFAIEGTLVRRLLRAKNPPIDAYLVMRREVVERMAGVPKEGQFSILHKPWFNLEIFHRFRRDDFKPKPKVESVMLRIRKKDKPLVKREDIKLYELLIKQGFGGGRRIKQNLTLAFTLGQLKNLAKEHGFKINDKPSDLILEQWIAIFKFLRYSLPESQWRRFVAKVRR